MVNSSHLIVINAIEIKEDFLIETTYFPQNMSFHHNVFVFV
jgi:hypothetical protein